MIIKRQGLARWVILFVFVARAETIGLADDFGEYSSWSLGSQHAGPINGGYGPAHRRFGGRLPGRFAPVYRTASNPRPYASAAFASTTSTSPDRASSRLISPTGYGYSGPESAGYGSEFAGGGYGYGAPAWGPACGAGCPTCPGPPGPCPQPLPPHYTTPNYGYHCTTWRTLGSDCAGCPAQILPVQTPELGTIKQQFNEHLARYGDWQPKERYSARMKEYELPRQPIRQLADVDAAEYSPVEHPSTDQWQPTNGDWPSVTTAAYELETIEPDESTERSDRGSIEQDGWRPTR